MRCTVSLSSSCIVQMSSAETKEGQNVVEMAGIAETYHFSQLERVHPEQGGAPLREMRSFTDEVTPRAPTM